MTDSKDTPQRSGEWIRANSRMILLAANGILILVLLGFALSQVVFWVQVNRILDVANELAAQETAIQPSKRNGDRPADARDRRRPETDSTTGTASSSAPTSETVATTATAESEPGTSATSPREQPDEFAFGPDEFLDDVMFLEDISSTTTTSETLHVQGAPTSATASTSGTGVAAVEPPTSGAIMMKSDATSGSAPRRMAFAVESRGDRRSRGDRGGRGGDGKQDDAQKAKFEKLTQRGLFGAKPPPPQQANLEAILGNSALVDGQWVTVGGRVREEKVVEIATHKIVLENAQGKRRDMLLIAGGPAGGPSGRPGGPTPGGGTGAPGAEGPGGPGKAVMSVEVKRAEMGGDMSQIPDFVFERLTGPGGRFEGMSREQLTERMREMREQRTREGGRGGGGGRGEGDAVIIRRE